MIALIALMACDGKDFPPLSPHTFGTGLLTKSINNDFSGPFRLLLTSDNQPGCVVSGAPAIEITGPVPNEDRCCFDYEFLEGQNEEWVASLSAAFWERPPESGVEGYGRTEMVVVDLSIEQYTVSAFTVDFALQGGPLDQVGYQVVDHIDTVPECPREVGTDYP